MNNGFNEKSGTMGIRFFSNPQTNMSATLDENGRLVEVMDNETNTIDYSGYSVTELAKFLSKFAKGGMTQGYDD